jgi:molybdate transport system regulatory protein
MPAPRQPLPRGPFFRNSRARKTGVRTVTTLKLRILFDDAMFGPGKAELLERIRDTGSIAAAGRQMEMSYKRAWMLVEEMNAAFRQPLIARTRGGPGGGGAHLTEAGVEVLRLYRAILDSAMAASADKITALERMLLPSPPTDISGET